MDRIFIMNMLETLTTDELFFRICHKKQYTAEQTRNILSSIQACPQFPDGTPIPTSMRTLASDALPDDFSKCQMEQRRVSILKHPCFMPPVLHTHDFFEAVYVLRGTCRMQLLGAAQDLKSGDFCLISPAASRSLYADGDSIVLLIRISLEAVEHLYNNTLHAHSCDTIAIFCRSSLCQKDYASYLLFHTGEDEEVRGQILDMYLEEKCGEEYRDYLITNMMLICFIKVIRKYMTTVQTPAFVPSSSKEAAYIYEYLQKNYAAASLNTLAKHLNYSVPYCSKHVRACTGQGFSDLLKHIRFQIATEYLTNSDMTVEWISDRIGYANPENFMRMFKKTYGVSPTQYRHMYTSSHKISACSTPPRLNSERAAR